MLLRPQPRLTVADLHDRVGDLNGQLARLAERGETVADTCLRLGPQHPVVRQRAAAVHQYRRINSTLQYSGGAYR